MGDDDHVLSGHAGDKQQYRYIDGMVVLNV